MSILDNPNLLKNILMGAGGTGIVGVMAITNLRPDESAYLLRVVPEPNSVSGCNANNADTCMDGKKFEEIEKVNYSYKELINGTTRYNNGDYVIYYGSEACPHCTGFLFGNEELSRGNLYLKRDKMSDGAFMKAYKYTRTNEALKSKNIKFLMYEDVPEVTKYTTNDDLWVLPWSTWDTTDLNKGRIKGEYKRNDKSAIEFRKVFKAARERFGDNAGGTPTAIIYKRGVGKIFYRDKLPGLNLRQQGEALSDDIELMNYIHYYYVAMDKAN
ncbi:hypothetical protein A6V39_04345 [Candidatus Mycoplasma haematobovis]|uniref:Uncharacterized protein n=1 Tax=Candidatus Mycoplasma haematobovis TaxID=432608 RepID=A0A1A9QDU2_9MOLU|nr:hypothetical protein [Candidatus Mycoplasma haematobovis]OAL10116.1 hypothetical protein A6V39_04345 [Candidatus Mycoplasma haematobovis]